MHILKLPLFILLFFCSIAIIESEALAQSYLVTNKAELIIAFDDAVAGDEIILMSNSTFNVLESDLPLALQPGVILQGNNAKIELATKPINEVIMIEAGDNTLIDNVQFLGPYITDGYRLCNTPNTTEGTKPNEPNGRCIHDQKVKGIVTTQLNGQYWTDVKVQNSKISGFSEGIVVAGNGRLISFQNTIENNWGDNYGYGIAIYGLHARAEPIYENTFQGNRHDIAGNGERNQVLVAHNNIVNGGKDHHFDMHGINMEQECTVNTCTSGTQVKIYSNTFNDTIHEAVLIRGIPKSNADIYDNTYTQTPDPSAFQYQTDALRQEKKDTGDNSIGITTYPYRGRCFDTNSTILGAKKLKAWLSGAQSQITVSKQLNVQAAFPLISFGNLTTEKSATSQGYFDDIFFLDRRYFRIMSSSSIGNDNLQCAPLNTQRTSLNDFKLADFDGDGRVDMFEANGGEFKLKVGVYDTDKKYASFDIEQETLQNSSIPFSDLRFGEFNGDNKTDVFITTGSQWKVSSGGIGPFNQVNSSGYKVHQLGFGDFNGDGVTDVFSTQGGQWKVSWSGSGGWYTVKTSSFTLSQLRFADFNGDGATDVFIKDGTTWRVSYGVPSAIPTSPNTLQFSNFNLLQSGRSELLSELKFADINGDRETDILIYE